SYERERTIDEENAFASLVEGDATLAMVGHMIQQQGRPLSSLTRNSALLRMLIRNGPDAIRGQEIESAPPIVRLPLVSRYLDGLVYCAALHGRRGWNGVDAAHRHLPASTEQILHPERYLAARRDDPIAVSPPPADALGRGWRPLGCDTLGEWGMRQTLARFVARRDAARAAAGWGGDRYRVYRRERDGALAMVLESVWDDEDEAREAQRRWREVREPGYRWEVRRAGRALTVRRLPLE
ncbi:MAG: hypothetical protein D6776_05230, partial [Planctomycetota bacterium]